MSFCSFSYDFSEKGKENKEKQYGFSARVEVGVLLLLMSSNIYPNPYSLDDEFDLDDDDSVHINNRKIDSLSDDPDTSIGVLNNSLMFDISYIFSEGIELYSGTPFYDNDRQGLTFGIAKTFDNESRLDFSVFGGIFYVWEDPFLVGVDRDKTELYFGGIMFDFDHILGSEFDIYVRAKHLETDKDLIGKRYPELQRKGEVTELGVRYNFELLKKHYLVPGICLIKSDMKGSSESYTGYKADLTYYFERENYSIFSSVSVWNNRYDDIHPIFNKTNDEDAFWLGAIYTRFNLFGFPYFYLRAGVGISNIDSNIDFYDTKSILTTVTFGYLY